MDILKQIDLIPSGDLLSRIQKFVLQAGSLIIYCDDVETGDWLKRVFDDNKEVIGGTVLRVMNAKACEGNILDKTSVYKRAQSVAKGNQPVKPGVEDRRMACSPQEGRTTYRMDFILYNGSSRLTGRLLK